MLALTLGMLLCVVLGLGVVCLVAIPAHREGRDLFTPRGDDVVSRVRDKTGDAIGATRDKAADISSRQKD